MNKKLYKSFQSGEMMFIRYFVKKIKKLKYLK